MEQLILEDHELKLLGKIALAKVQSEIEYTDAEIGQAIRVEIEELRRQRDRRARRDGELRGPGLRVVT